jgi:YHS domain-containing protein
MATDPVCKKEVDEKAPPGGKVNYWGTVFYFCTADCRNAFRRDPPKYAPETVEERGPEYTKRPLDWRA